MVRQRATLNLLMNNMNYEEEALKRISNGCKDGEDWCVEIINEMNSKIEQAKCHRCAKRRIVNKYKNLLAVKIRDNSIS